MYYLLYSNEKIRNVKGILNDNKKYIILSEIEYNLRLYDRFVNVSSGGVGYMGIYKYFSCQLMIGLVIVAITISGSVFNNAVYASNDKTINEISQAAPGTENTTGKKSGAAPSVALPPAPSSDDSQGTVPPSVIPTDQSPANGASPSIAPAGDGSAQQPSQGVSPVPSVNETSAPVTPSSTIAPSVEISIPPVINETPVRKPGIGQDNKNEKIKAMLLPIIVTIGILILGIGGYMAFSMKKGKQQYICERCGKPVLPGMVYCEECSDSDLRTPYLEPEKMAPPISAIREEAKPVREPVATLREHVPPASVQAVQTKKKPRPSGRVIAVITVRRGNNQGHRYSFYETVRQMTFGSDPECDILIEDDEAISQRHAVISMAEDTSFLIHDMGDTSGLYVNNERVRQSSLKSGDVIRMGKTEFTFARL